MSQTPTPPAPFDGKEFVRELTTAPGVYRMLDADGRALYVGKAMSLRKRNFGFAAALSLRSSVHPNTPTSGPPTMRVITPRRDWRSDC